MKNLHELFPREYVFASRLNSVVFVVSFVGIIGIGLPLTSLVSTPGTSLAFLACLCALVGASVLMCCGPQERGMDGKCQLTAAMVCNSIAALLNFISIWLIIWAWDAFAKAMAGARCNPSLTREECDQAIEELSSTVAAVLWTTWIYIIFCCALSAYTVRAQLQAKRAMEAAADVNRQAQVDGVASQIPPPMEGYPHRPVVTGSMMPGWQPPSSYAQQPHRDTEMGAVPAQEGEAAAGAQGYPVVAGSVVACSQPPPAYAQQPPHDAEAGQAPLGGAQRV